MLVVVHDRTIQRLDHTALDLETAGCGDVLQVDRAEARAQPDQSLDDLVRVLGGEHDRDRVQTTERLEQRGLALHDRQRGQRTDIAEAEHRASVTDHGDQSVRPGVAGGKAGVGVNGPAYLRNTGGVGDR